MRLDLDIQCATEDAVPDVAELREWVLAALLAAGREHDTELAVRVVGIPEITRLNERFRGRPEPTNVLSFPADLPPELALPLLGDIVICAPVVAQEAGQQGKSEQAHWAHMAVHGTLHLLGYDHIQDREAEIMEALETDILTALNFPRPYGEVDIRKEQVAP